MNWRTFSLSFAIGVCISTIYFNSIGAYRMALLLCGVLGITTLVQLLLLRRLIKRQIQMEIAWMERALPEIEQAVADYEQAVRADAPRSDPDAATRDEMRRLRDEITQARGGM